MIRIPVRSNDLHAKTYVISIDLGTSNESGRT